jgi:glyoxylase-like metal-dependent hydrolase (beta-lactamase superfamily II)/rhodanese-related sulfurtransferase
MIFEQYQLACLSLSSYLIGDENTGRAVVVDPQRDISNYLTDAETRGLTIEAVILTHFHADYVSGHLELAKATGAEICFGEVAEAEFPIRNLTDGERIDLGEVKIEAWATPGHTPESISLLVFEKGSDSAPFAVLTGDTLFVGDVGRPDLLSAIGYTADQLGRQLYGSVRRLADLPDQVRVYPGHGAGSACGKQLGSDPFTTIGTQKHENYALQEMTEDEFVAIVTEGQPAAPSYFLHDAVTNRSEHNVFDEDQKLPAMSIEQVLQAQEAGAVVVDTRLAAAFASGHLRGAVNVALDGRFAEQVGMMVAADTDVIVTGDPGTEAEARVRLGRIGFDRVLGYLADYEAVLMQRSELVVNPERIPATDLAGLDPDQVQLLDVRNPNETDAGIIPGAIVIPLGALPREVDKLDTSRPVVVYCATGVRSSVASSWLRANGFKDVIDVMGGYQAWGELTPA